MYHYHYQLPFFSQLPNNFSVSNKNIFFLHLLAKLTKVIKEIGSPVQKE